MRMSGKQYESYQGQMKTNNILELWKLCSAFTEVPEWLYTMFILGFENELATWHLSGNYNQELSSAYR